MFTALSSDPALLNDQASTAGVDLGQVASTMGGAPVSGTFPGFIRILPTTTTTTTTTTSTTTTSTTTTTTTTTTTSTTTTTTTTRPTTTTTSTTTTTTTTRPTTTTTLPVLGCRITGGGSVGGVLFPAEIQKAQLSGQVGAPCGCRGCYGEFDPKLASVQGEWHHQRKNKGGSLAANTFNSLVCACRGGSAGPGTPCMEEHPIAERDHICITGVGDFTPDTGPKQSMRVAFRFEADDGGESGREDFYQMRIFKPKSSTLGAEDDIAKALCCTRAYAPPDAIANLIADDSGLLLTGNIQIHPELKKSEEFACPPPDGVCVPIP